MIPLPTLTLFLGAVLVLFLSPGPNMLFLLSQGVAHGPRAGLAAAAGISAADLTLGTLTATGLAALMGAWPWTFEVIRYAGVAYLLWLAWGTWRGRGPVSGPTAEPLSSMAIARTAMFTCLLNPKALLFFLVFLPQFVDPKLGLVGWQLATLGGVLAVMSLIFHSLLALFSGQVGRWLRGGGGAMRGVLTGLFLFLALRLVFVQLH